MQDKDMKLIMESWRKNQLNEFFSIGQQIGSELFGAGAEEQLKNLLDLSLDHSDRMAKKIIVLERAINYLLGVKTPAPPTSNLKMDSENPQEKLNAIFSKREKQLGKILDSVRQLQQRKG